MQHHFLYVYFGKERRVTSCLILDDSGELLARGLAFCSFKDQPCKRRGRMIAEGRAMKAVDFATSDGSSFGFLKADRPEVEQILEESGIDLWPPDAVAKQAYMREIPEAFKYKAEYRPLEISDKEEAVRQNFIRKMKERQSVTAADVGKVEDVIDCSELAAVPA